MHTTRHAAVLGHPITHSLSPVLHTAAYQALGLNHWRYSAHDVTEDTLKSFLHDLSPHWAGLSLTMPLKQKIIPLLDHIEPLAAAVGAVNTVLLSTNDTHTGIASMSGTNTDVYGIRTALCEGLGTRPVTDAVLLGGGATAASALAALAELGCTTPLVFVRSLNRITPLRDAADRLGVQPQIAPFDYHATPYALTTADAVISTIPQYAADPWAHQLTTHNTPPHGVLLDVVYDPRPTALQTAWTAQGAHTVGGERMLLHQAAEQVRLMTGYTAPLDNMEQALHTALAHHGS